MRLMESASASCTDTCAVQLRQAAVGGCVGRKRRQGCEQRLLAALATTAATCLEGLTLKKAIAKMRSPSRGTATMVAACFLEECAHARVCRCVFAGFAHQPLQRVQHNRSAQCAGKATSSVGDILDRVEDDIDGWKLRVGCEETNRAQVALQVRVVARMRRREHAADTVGRHLAGRLRTQLLDASCASIQSPCVSSLRGCLALPLPVPATVIRSARARAWPARRPRPRRPRHLNANTGTNNE